MATPLFNYVLRLADNALVLGHRLSEWCGHAPNIEIDLALANMSLDLIGQARNLYTYAGEVEGKGRSEDQLAYLRDVRDWRNVLLVERPIGDFAFTITRQFLYAAYARPYYEWLRGSNDATLAAIAAKAEKELAYHLRHSAEWVIRLGDGTDESHARMKEALADLWPFTGEMFECSAEEQALVDQGIACNPGFIKPVFDTAVDQVLAEATLSRPRDGWMQTGGLKGEHSEHLGHVLCDLQFMQRTYPNATW